MGKVSAKATDHGKSLRVNLVISDRRDRELFNELNKSDVNDRASILKHLCIIGMYSEKLAFSDRVTTKPARKKPSPDKAATEQEPPTSAKPAVKLKESEPGEKRTRDYASSDLGGASDLGLEF